MNKYIENLTVAEYETLIRLLKKLEPVENKQMKESGNTKDYVELRCLIIKMQKIVKKYKKDI